MYNHLIEFSRIASMSSSPLFALGVAVPEDVEISLARSKLVCSAAALCKSSCIDANFSWSTRTELENSFISLQGDVLAIFLLTGSITSGANLLRKRIFGMESKGKAAGLWGIEAGSSKNSCNKFWLLRSSRSKALNWPERALNFSNQKGLHG